MLDWALTALSWLFGGVSWASVLLWIGRNVPGLACLLVGFIGLVIAFWRHQSARSGFRLSPRYFRDWLVVIFGGALCTAGLLLLLGWIEPG